MQLGLVFAFGKEESCGLRGAMVSVVAFRADGRGIKSTHSCSHTVQKPSINLRPVSQWTLKYTYHLPYSLKKAAKRRFLFFGQKFLLVKS